MVHGAWQGPLLHHEPEIARRGQWRGARARRIGSGSPGGYSEFIRTDIRRAACKAIGNAWKLATCVNGW